MLNLSYSASYDPYHTAFRLLVLLRGTGEVKVNYDWLRIADFYFCFPQRLSEFRPPRSVKGMQGRINGIIKMSPNAEYASLPDSNVLFERMELIQQTALSALSKQMIIKLSLEGNRRFVTLVSDKIPKPLLEELEKSSEEQGNLINVLTVDFQKIEILGPGGLKDRSGLGEFQYDTV
jgi:hypothetical protein